MFRISGRRPPTTLDEDTVERMLDGGSIDDLPDGLRPLGEVLAAASGAPTRAELEGSAAIAASFVTARAAVGRTPTRARSIGVSVFTVLALAASTGTAVAATQGALPDPVQQVAHEALGVVGISVPSINDGTSSGGHGQTVITTDETAVPGAPEVTTPATGGTATAGSAGATATTGKGSTDAGSNGNSSNSNGSSGPPEVPPGQVDKPVDTSGGSTGGDPSTSPGNSDFGHSQGNGVTVPPGQAKK